jgi:hypothetical protein
MGAHGPCVDINILIYHLKLLKRLITDEKVTEYQDLSDTIDTAWGDVKTYLDAASTNDDLDDSPTLDDPILNPPS